MRTRACNRSSPMLTRYCLGTWNLYNFRHVPLSMRVPVPRDQWSLSQCERVYTHRFSRFINYPVSQEEWLILNLFSHAHRAMDCAYHIILRPAHAMAPEQPQNQTDDPESRGQDREDWKPPTTFWNQIILLGTEAVPKTRVCHSPPVPRQFCSDGKAWCYMHNGRRARKAP